MAREPAAEAEIGVRALNRALLARQLLLEPAALPPPAVLERVAGIQAQYAPSTYVGLWTRSARLEDRAVVDRALREAAVVQGTLMRVTIHAVARADYWPFAIAVRAARREQWLRAQRGAVTAAEMTGRARRLRRRLADGPVTRRELEAVVGRRPYPEGINLWLDLVRVPPASTWDHRPGDLYALAEDHAGPPPALTPAAALDHLVGRYLAAFGPASRKDVASWAGMRVADVAPALRRLGAVAYRGPGGAELLDLPGAPLPDPETPAPVRLLPHFDATMMIHARRTGLLPEQHRSRIFTSKNPASVGTVLVDGVVAGTWRFADGGVAVEALERLDRATRRAVDAEVDRLRAFSA